MASKSRTFYDMMDDILLTYYITFNANKFEYLLNLKKFFVNCSCLEKILLRNFNEN